VLSIGVATVRLPSSSATSASTDGKHARALRTIWHVSPFAQSLSLSQVDWQVG
jgi:hypothetical protein